jgi:recombination protein RecA
MGATPAILQQLREQIEKLEAAPRELLLSLRTGVAQIDALNLFRFGAAIELSGETASGKTSLALKVLASATKEQRLVAWVDGPKEIYPPAAQSLGVDLSRLLIVRPGAPAKLVWSAVQLLRSGAFACVVLDVLHTGLKLSMVEAKKLLDAARLGGSMLLLLTSISNQAQGLPRVLMRSVSQGSSEPTFELQLPQRSVRVERTAYLRQTTETPAHAVETLIPTPKLSVVSLPQIKTNKDARLEQRYNRDGPGFHSGTRPGRDSALTIAPTQTAQLKIASPGDYLGRFGKFGRCA